MEDKVKYYSVEVEGINADNYESLISLLGVMLMNIFSAPIRWLELIRVFVVLTIELQIKILKIAFGLSIILMLSIILGVVVGKESILILGVGIITVLTTFVFLLLLLLKKSTDDNNIIEIKEKKGDTQFQVREVDKPIEPVLEKEDTEVVVKDKTEDEHLPKELKKQLTEESSEMEKMEMDLESIAKLFNREPNETDKKVIDTVSRRGLIDLEDLSSSIEGLQGGI